MLLSFPDYNHSSTMYVLEQCRFRVLLGNEQNIKRGGCQKGETGVKYKTQDQTPLLTMESKRKSAGTISL